MDKSLSNFEVMGALNNKINVMTYTQLANYDNIENVLGPNKAVVLLYLTKWNYGHYTCLFLNSNNKLHYFDSYGDTPDYLLKYIPEYFREESLQKLPHLTYLLWKCKYQIEYNDYKLQKMGKNITTCGRWCIIRLLNKELSDKQFAENFINKKKPADKIIYEMTKNI